jgi:hypothetical protein
VRKTSGQAVAAIAAAPRAALDVPLALAIVALGRPDHRGSLAGSRANAADVTPYRRTGPAAVTTRKEN